jgi:RNA polymerase sigma-70 factor (ECF subfamily)
MLPAEPALLTRVRDAEVEDEALVAALLRGSQPAATMIWRRYASLVRGALYRALGPDQEIEDLLQEVFIRFVKSAGRAPEVSNVKAYLLTIAYRTASLEIRKRKVRRWITLSATGEPQELFARHGQPEEVLALRELYRILDTLSTRQRLVFIARHVEGLPIHEAADALLLPRSTVGRMSHLSLGIVMKRARNCPALASYVERSLRQ